MMQPNTYINEATLTMSALAAGSTVQSSTLVNQAWRGVVVVIDITALGASATLTVTVEGYDPKANKYYTILASAALAATGTTILRVYPGLTASANAVANDILPTQWRVKAVTAVQTVTGTVSAHAII